jgi:hypothetical protein
VVRRLIPHPLCREFPKLLIDQRQQLVGGFGIASLDRPGTMW